MKKSILLEFLKRHVCLKGFDFQDLSMQGKSHFISDFIKEYSCKEGDLCLLSSNIYNKDSRDLKISFFLSELKFKNKFLSSFDLFFFEQGNTFVFDYYNELVFLSEKFDLITDDSRESFHGKRDYFLNYKNPTIPVSHFRKELINNDNLYNEIKEQINNCLYNLL